MWQEREREFLLFSMKSTGRNDLLRHASANSSMFFFAFSLFNFVPFFSVDIS